MDFLRPSPRLWRVRLVELGAAAALLTLGAIVVAVVQGGLVALAAFLLLLVATGTAATVLRRRVLSWGYAVREDDLVVRRGVLVRRLTVVPYGRMQFIDVTAGPFERAFGLATVQLHTAAAATDARIPGLDAAEAARLRDRLSQLGESRAAGL